MSDESLFLEAVKAAPDDLSLRLVYADWLEERGDARCEYLRVDGELQKHCKLCFENAVRAQMHRGTNSFGTRNCARFDYDGRASDDE